jgi:hypothetical protein
MKARGIALLLAVLAYAPAARAAPTASTEAKRLADEARSSFRKGDYRSSLETLERLQKIAPDPRHFWNMAACENKLGHHSKAIADVERYMSATPSLTSEETSAATQFLTAARAYVGTVSVTSTVDGTQVTIDGDVVGETPLAQAVILDEGQHRVRFAREKFKTVERVEQVQGGTDARWSVVLEPDAPPPASRRPSRVIPLALGGGGFALAAAGATFAVITLNKASTLQAECGSTCAPSRWQSFSAMQTVGDVMLVAGGAAIAAAVITWVLQPGARKSDQALTPLGAATF